MKPRAFIGTPWKQEGIDPDWRERRRRAASAELSVEEMKAYAEDHFAHVRIAVISRPDFPDAWLDIMSEDSSLNVKEVVGRKSGVSVETLQSLSRHPELSVRATPKWRTGQQMTIGELCEHAINTQRPDDLEALSTHPAREVRRLLARRKDLPGHLNAALANDPDWYVRQQLLYHHKYLQRSLMEQLAGDSSWLVRKMVPRNKHCPTYLIEQLTKDSSPWVRQSIVLSYRLEERFVTPLGGDRSRQVSRSLAQRSRDAAFLAKSRALKATL